MSTGKMTDTKIYKSSLGLWKTRKAVAREQNRFSKMEEKTAPITFSILHLILPSSYVIVHRNIFIYQECTITDDLSLNKSIFSSLFSEDIFIIGSHNHEEGTETTFISHC